MTREWRRPQCEVILVIKVICSTYFSDWWLIWINVDVVLLSEMLSVYIYMWDCWGNSINRAEVVVSGWFEDLDEAFSMYFDANIYFVCDMRFWTSRSQVEAFKLVRWLRGKHIYCECLREERSVRGSEARKHRCTPPRSEIFATHSKVDVTRINLRSDNSPNPFHMHMYCCIL